MAADIYNDHTYLTNNPNLHLEDSEFKFASMEPLLREVRVPSGEIKILDVGGGAGILGGLVAAHFEKRGLRVDFVALDLSAEMLSVQSRNNPQISRTLNCSIVDCDETGFDLVLMIDVIEHIPDLHAAADRLAQIGDCVIYNIPIQVNLFDMLRNLMHRGRYYCEQERLIGHLHFFSYARARRFVNQHHVCVASLFKPYCFMMLHSSDPGYVRLRASRLRLAEVRLSCLIAKYLGWIAPWIVQGSMFVLAANKHSEVIR